MNRTPVTSSHIKSVGHDPITKTLEIEFSSGKVFSYAGVPPETHAAMLAADSVGGFFSKNIKTRFVASSV